MMVDEWLLEVRAELDKQGMLHARSIKVDADGEWSVVVEEAERSNKRQKGNAHNVGDSPEETAARVDLDT